MDQIKGLVDGKIDFVGQRLADRLNQEILVIGAAGAFLLGCVFSSLQVMYVSLGAIAVVDLLIVVPPWPIFKKHETKWLPSRPASATVGAKKAD